MTVLTRAESQQRTRARILSSATQLCLEKGFVATSQAEVAAHAGYTRGAVYSNFASKAEMGVAVIDGLYADAFDELERSLSAAPVDGWFGALAEWGVRTMGDPAWARLEVEVAAHGDDTVRAATARRYADLRKRLTRLAQQYLDRLGVPATIVPEIAGQFLVGLGIGLGLQRAIDPEAVDASTLIALADAAQVLAADVGGSAS